MGSNARVPACETGDCFAAHTGGQPLSTNGNKKVIFAMASVPHRAKRTRRQGFFQPKALITCRIHLVGPVIDSAAIL